MTRSDEHNLSSELSAYLDGELTPERAKEVEQWLASSSSARAQLENLRSVRDELANLPRVEAPVELHKRIRSQITRRDGRRAEHMHATAARLPAWRFVSRAAGVAAVIVAGVFAWWRVTEIPPAAPSSARVVAPAAGGPSAAEAPQRAVADDSAAPTPADVAEAIADEHRPRLAEPPRVATLDDEEARRLAALGCVAGTDLVEDDEPEQALASAGQSVPGVAAAPDQLATDHASPSAEKSPTVAAAASAARDGEIEPDPVSAARPAGAAERDESRAAGAAPPGPDMRVIVQAETLAQYESLARALSAWRVLSDRAERIASSASDAATLEDRAAAESGDSAVAFAGTQEAGSTIALSLRPPAIGKLLQMLDQQAPHGVRVAMLFRPDEMAAAGDLLRYAPPTMARISDPNRPVRRRVRHDSAQARHSPGKAGREIMAYESLSGRATDTPSAPRFRNERKPTAKGRVAGAAPERSASRPARLRRAGALRPFGDAPEDEELAAALAILEELGVDTSDLTPGPPGEPLVYGVEWVGDSHEEYVPAYHLDPNRLAPPSENHPKPTPRAQFLVRVVILPPPAASRPADAASTQPND